MRWMLEPNGAPSSDIRWASASLDVFFRGDNSYLAVLVPFLSNKPC